jgi:hypothetical protein
VPSDEAKITSRWRHASAASEEAVMGCGERFQSKGRALSCKLLQLVLSAYGGIKFLSRVSEFARCSSTASCGRSGQNRLSTVRVLKTRSEPIAPLDRVRSSVDPRSTSRAFFVSQLLHALD